MDECFFLEGVQLLINGLYSSRGSTASRKEWKELARTVYDWEYWWILTVVVRVAVWMMPTMRRSPPSLISNNALTSSIRAPIATVDWKFKCWYYWYNNLGRITIILILWVLPNATDVEIVLLFCIADVDVIPNWLGHLQILLLGPELIKLKCRKILFWGMNPSHDI